MRRLPSVLRLHKQLASLLRVPVLLTCFLLFRTS